MPRPIDYVDVAYLIAVALHDGRKKSVQAVEVRQSEEHVAAERLQAAAGVACAVAQHGAAHRIGDARLQFLEAGRLTPDALPRDQADARLPGFERANEGGQKRRVVLAVAIERDDQRPARGGNARA